MFMRFTRYFEIFMNDWTIIMNNSIFFEQVGNQISLVLREKNMTQQSLATSLNISKQVLNKIILGQKAINIAEITKIAAALDTSVESLLNVSAPTPVEPTFSFMGSIQNPKTKEKVLLLKEVIDEILFLEDYANGTDPATD